MRIGVDTGGTFADIIAIDSDGKLYGRKVPSTPADLSACFLAGVEAVLEAYPSAQPRPAMLLHGTTVATNALIENRFPTIGLIVTEGFREILQVTRYVAPTERDSAHTEMPPPQVVPLELVHEVRERIDAQGTVRLGLDDAQIRTVARWYQQKGVRIVAVSLLHSYANPSHERKIKDILQAEYRDVTVVLSSDVLPEFREYERTITTCLQAALIPVLGHYVEQLGRQIQARTWRAPLFVMQSSGGIRSAHAAIRKPLSTVLSGPSAAGVGMAWLGMQAGFPDLITLDMGGTSTDVSLVRNGQLQVTTSGHVHGYPLRMPTVDVVSIGAGGGSVAWWGREGRLHVGPRSAGAEPGPVCYGQGGDEVTVTDAHLVLGRLPHALLDGTLTLNRTAAEAALAEFGRRKRLGPGEMASGIVQIANHQMCGAVRHISVRRGHDPRNYVLLAMGGAGPLHATELAELLGMNTVLIPPAPGLAAAFGLLVADFRADFVHAFRRRESEIDATRVRQVIDALEAQAWTGLAREEIPVAQRQLVRAADFHYAGMSAEWTVPLGGGPVTADTIHQTIEDFHCLFERRCGYSYRGKEEVELINLRVTGIGLLPKPSLPTIVTATSDPLPVGRRSVFFLERRGFVDCPIYTRVGLGAGATFTGPAIVEQYDSTTVISPGWQARVDTFGNLILQR